MSSKITAADVLADLLGELGDDLSASDLTAVIAFSGQAARVAEARRRIDEEGLIVEDSKGFAVPHPALDIERAASREMRGWETSRPDLFARSAPVKPLSGGGRGETENSGDASGITDDELAAARAARLAGA